MNFVSYRFVDVPSAVQREPFATARWWSTKIWSTERGQMFDGSSTGAICVWILRQTARGRRQEEVAPTDSKNFPAADEDEALDEF